MDHSLFPPCSHFSIILCCSIPGGDNMQIYILYKLKTPQHNFNIVSIHHQHTVKFQDFNVNTVSTQHQLLTIVEILLTFSC